MTNYINTMAWAQELKSLVEDIQSSTVDRIKYVKDLKADVRGFLARVDRELKVMAKDLRDFLDKSEATRMEDFKGTMKGIQADIKRLQQETADVQKEARALIVRFQKELKELAADLKVFLTKSEHDRIADFKGMMKQIDTDLTVLRHDTAQTLGRYERERHQAAGYWAALRKKTRVAGAPPRAKK